MTGWNGYQWWNSSTMTKTCSNQTYSIQIKLWKTSMERKSDSENGITKARRFS